MEVRAGGLSCPQVSHTEKPAEAQTQALVAKADGAAMGNTS